MSAGDGAVSGHPLLVTFEGTQHTVVFQGNQCVDDIAARYLVDLTLPPPDTRCS